MVTCKFSLEVFELFVLALVETTSGNRWEPSNVHLIPLLSVSRGFRYSTQKHLFKSVLIRTRGSKRVPHRASLLLDVLSSSPHIVKFVSQVHVSLPPYSYLVEEESSASSWTADMCPVHATTPSACPGVESDPNLAKVLFLLTTGRVKHLEISSGSVGPYVNPRIPKLGAEVLGALGALRCSPFLSSLALRGRFADVPPAIVNGDPSQDNLTKLEMTRAEWGCDYTTISFPTSRTGDEVTQGAPQYRLRRLEQLVITDFSCPYFGPPRTSPIINLKAQLACVRAFMAFPNLKSLRIEIGSDTLAEFFTAAHCKILAELVSCAPALEHFSFANMNVTEILNDEFVLTVGPVLGKAPQLRSIELRDARCGIDNGVLRSLARLFAGKRFNGPLERVHFRLHYDVPPAFDVVFDEFCMAFGASWNFGWGELGGALGPVETLQSIMVVVSFPFAYFPEDEICEIVQRLRHGAIQGVDNPTIHVCVERPAPWAF